MEIKDLTGLSKPLTRLIEVISAGCGKVFGPALIRKTADAEAYRIKTIAAALADASKQSVSPVVYDNGALTTWRKPEDGTFVMLPSSTEERAESRIEYQERKRQDNIESVASEAAEELADATDVPAESPDEDWITRFFGYAQEISADHMQKIWGKILAGEICNPGSFSLKALDTLRNFSVTDAALFERFVRCAFIAMTETREMFVVTEDKHWLDKARGVSFPGLLTLAELGVMFPGDLGYAFFGDPKETSAGFEMGDHLLRVTRPGAGSRIDFPIWRFTAVGKELASLVKVATDFELLRLVGTSLPTSNTAATIHVVHERLPGNLIRATEIEKVK